MAHSNISKHLYTSFKDSCKFFPLSELIKLAISFKFDSIAKDNFKTIAALRFMETNLQFT